MRMQCVKYLYPSTPPPDTGAGKVFSFSLWYRVEAEDDFYVQAMGSGARGLAINQERWTPSRNQERKVSK